MQINSSNQLDTAGFTLVELLVAMVAASLVLLGVMRLFDIALSGYTLQSQTSDMHQNAHYAIRNLTDLLMQAGSALPDTSSGVPIVAVSSTSDISIRVNPEGGNHVVEGTPGLVQSVPVSSPSKFARADSVVIVVSGGGSHSVVAIDKGYTTGTFVNGIDETNNLLRLATAVTLGQGDRICSFNSYRIYRNSSAGTLNRVINGQDFVLAEDIESLSVVFSDISGSTVNTWNPMKFAHIHVTARTSRSDRRYTHPVKNDGYRRSSLEMDLRLRNKP